VKSALAAILGITGEAAILLAVPVEEKAPIVYSSPAKWAHEYGAPEVPQIEEHVKVPEPSEHYSAVQAKTEKQASQHHKHVSRPRPNFFERLIASFMNLQKHQPAKSPREGTSNNLAAAPSKAASFSTKASSVNTRAAGTSRVHRTANGKPTKRRVSPD